VLIKPRINKYKTELCRTYEESGACKYGAKCQFAHGLDELRGLSRPPLLRHSLSFAGFSSLPQTFQPVEQIQPSSLLFTRASSVSPPPSSAGSPELLSPLFPEPGALKHCSYPFSGMTDLAGGSSDSALRFYPVTDSVSVKSTPSTFISTNSSLPYNLPQKLPVSLSSLPGLQRCSSADSLSEEGYTSSCSLSSSSSGTESPSFEGRRLPIFSRLSVSDE
uniref:mRNA decay activator protein ZFP36 n=1 Tax=Monopterus albus TaxID=43700 RepID=A0A3Q3KL37_MONAL